MVSDDKKGMYRNISTNHDHGKKTTEDIKHNYSKPADKFASIPASNVNLYTAICFDCHSEVKINFEPVADKPFYCDFCFNHHRIHPKHE